MKVKQYPLYAMLLPSAVFLVVFIYIPMYGVILAFKTFTISGGVFGSPWADPWWENFWWIKDKEFWYVFGNTVKIAGVKFITGFPAPIILALMINEIVNKRYKKTIQTVLYLPHFISWVIFAGIVYRIIGGSADSPVNILLKAFGADCVDILSQERNFLWVVVTTALLKDVGWGTIIYLAAISAADPQLYDAAALDGCGQWQKMRHITLPAIAPIVTILLILSMPGLLSAGFDQIWNLSNALVARSANIIDVYIVRIGVQGGQYSYAVSIGLATKIASLGLVLLANRINRQGFGYGIF